MHTCMCACAYLCKCACMYLFSRVILCVHLCTQVCVHVCVRLQGCVNADVRACGGGCMHICVEECAHVVSGPASSPPGNLQWGWLACTANTQTLVLLVPLPLNPLLSNHLLMLNHVRDSLPRDTVVKQHKTIIKNCPEGLWTPRPAEGRFRPLIQTVHIRIYTEKPV